ncbi:MAG: T9SS type A sorting domain-containing protein [Ferruginibacter sp.]
MAANASIGALQITSNTPVTLQSTTTTTRTLTLTGSVGNELDVAAGSSLILNHATQAAAIAFSTGTAMTGSIAGTLTFAGSTSNVLTTTGGTGTVVTVQGTGIVNLNTTAVSLVGSVATLSFAGSSTCNAAGATTGAPPVPLATWATTSNLNITGITSSTTAPTNNAQSFGNFSYNCPSASATMSIFTTSTVTIKGDLTIVTGSGRLRLLTSGNLTVGGNISATAGNFDLMNGAATLNVTGNVSLSNGATGNFANGAGTINIGGNVTLSNSSAVNFGNAAAANTTTITGNVNLNSSGTSVLSATSGTTNTVNVNGDFNISNGTFGIGSGTGGGTLKVKGNFNQTGGVIGLAGSATTGNIEFNGTASQNVTFTSAMTGLVSVRLNNAAGINLTGPLAINNGATYTVSAGTTSGSGTITYDATSSKLVYNGTSGTQTANAKEFPASNGPVSLTINNTATAPNNIVAASFSRTLGATGVLALTAGILDINGNSLTIPNTVAAAVTGGSATTYVKGTLIRSLPASLVTGSTYLFPVGKSVYNGFDLINPTTNAGGPLTIQVEAFDGNSGGTPGLLMSSLNTGRYWAASITSGSANFTNSFIKLSDTRGTLDGIASSTTLTGSYDHVGGATSTLAAGSITSTAPAATSIPGFFVMGNLAAATLTNLAITPTGNQCTNVARTVTVTATPGAAAVTSVTLNYSVNGVSQTGISMTNTSGNDWSGTIPTVTPVTATVTWSVTATDGNNLTKTATGTSYNDEPAFGVSASASATITTLCAGQPTSLSVILVKGGTFTLGAGASTSTNSGNSSGISVSPFSHYYGGYKSQYVIRSSELTALGMPAGNITRLAFNVTTAGTTYPGFTIKISNTTATAASASSFLTGTAAQQVFSADYTPAVGTNDIVFTTPFAWNGTSNIMIDICWSENNAGGTAAEVKYDAAAFNTQSYWRDDEVDAASMCAVTVPEARQTNRPQLRFTVDNAPVATAYSWSNGTSVVGTTNPLTVNPTVNTNYTATVTTLGCPIVSNAVTINATPLPAAPSPNSSVQCGTAVPAAFVTSGGGGAGYKWFLTQFGGTPIPGQTGASLSGYSISTTTHFWVSESNGTCESLRAEVIATVNQPDAILASVDNNNPCANSAIQLSVVQTGFGNGNTYTYSWTASPQAGSGLPASPTAGASIPVTPTATGTYTYTASGIDGSCTATSTVVVTVKASPSNVVASSSVTPCEGGTTMLSATFNSGLTTLINYTEGFETYPPAGWTFINAGSGNTWIASTTLVDPTPHTGANAMAYLYNSSFAANAWGITPGQDLVAGTTYTISFWYNTSSVSGLYPEKLKVTVGTLATVVAQTTILWNNNGGSNLVNETYAQGTATFTPSVSGTYYFGFNCYSDADRDALFVDDISITGGLDPASTFSWTSSPAGFTSSAQNPPSPVTVNVPTTYTLTVTNAIGCSGSGSVTVTPHSLPPAPSGSNGTDQCGTALTDATVSSNSSEPTPTFKWYLVPTGGTAVQTGASTTYLSTISATTTFYVAEVSSFGCEGPRTSITTVVSDPDPLSVTATSTSICIGGSTDISSSYTPEFNSFATFDLTATGGAASGVTGTVSLTPSGAGNGSDPFTVTPTATGTYTYTITAVDPDKGCVSVGTVVVTVGALPSIVGASASPSTAVCAGAPVSLTAVTSVVAAGTRTIGSGTSSNSTTTTDGTFYSSYYGNGHTQILYTASELTAAGLSPGNITSLGTVLSSIGSSPVTMNGFTIKMAATAATSITTFQSPTFTTVYGPTNYTPVVGTNTNTFSTPFVWNGSSNIIVDYCFANGVSGTSSNTTINTYTTTAFASFVNYQVDGSVSDPCANTTVSNATSNRPNLIFSGQVATTGAGSYSWSWNPGSLSGNTVTVNPLTTTTYTATATLNGCSVNSSPVTVTVNPLPAAPGTNDPVTRCGPGSVTLTATGSGGTLKWYNVASGGIALQTGGSYTTTVSGTTIFYVAETSAAGCEGPRSAVNVTVTTAPTLAITPSGATTFCQGGSVTLNGANASSSSYTNFSWSVNPSTGSGLSSNTVAIVTATPTASGTFTYTLTADDGQVNGCSNTTTIVVTVNPNPVVVSATANPTTVCAGGASSLSATTNIVGAGSAASIGTGTTLTTASALDPTAFNNRYSQYWGQYLYTAAELHAAGLQAGNITGITFNINTLGDAATNANFSISIGTTASTTLTSFVTTGLTQVLVPTTYTHAVGLNTITFTTPFNWDGVSNLIIDQRHDGANSTNNARTFFTATAGNMVISAVTTTSSSSATLQSEVQGSLVTPSLSTKRLNIIFTGQVLTTGPGTYNWTWNPGNISGSSVTVNPTSSTTYTVTATDAATGCSTNGVPVTVTVTPVGANATATPSTPVCAGTTVTLNGGATGGGPFTYSWTNGVTVIGTSNQVTVNPTITTSYTVTVTDNCGNSTTSSITVNINPLPTAGIAETGPISICAPATQVLTATTNAAAPSYQWQLNGNNIPGATNATYTVTASGSYTVVVTNTTTNCVSTASSAVVVTINVKPTTVAVTPLTTTICNGAIVALSGTVSTVSAVSGTGASTTSGNATDATLGPNPFQIFYGGDKQQSLYLASELTALGMGPGSVISSVKFNLPTADATLSLASLRIKMKNTTTSSLTTTWEPSMTIVRTAAAFTPVVGINTLVLNTPFTWDGTSNLVVEVTYSNNNSGTTGTTYNTAKYSPTSFASTIFYRVDASSAATLNNYTGTVSFSYNSRTDMTFDFTNPGSITWSPQTGLYTNAGATTPYTGAVATSVFAKPSATTTYTATATSTAGCTNSGTSVITVNPRPTGTLSGGATYCAGQGSTTTTLSIAVTGAGPWSGTLSPGAVPFSGSSSPITVSVTPSSTTTYTIATLNGSQCSSIAADLSGSATVTINPVPATPTISPVAPTAQCGGTITLTSSSATGNQWNLEGAPIGGATSQTLVVSASGNYSVTVTNGFNCSVTSLVTAVTINPVPATPTVTPAGPITQCGGTVTLTSSSATGNQWNLGGSPIGGATNQTLVVSASGNYSVTVTNGFGCSATSANTTVTINPLPATPTITPVGPVTQCGGTVTLTASTPGAWQWNLEGSPIDGANNQTLIVSASGNYSVTVTNEFGCSATSAVTSVTINPVPATPTISAGGPITFCEGGSVTLTSSSATNNQWNLNGAPIGGTTNSTLVVTASGDYTVTVTNAFGCTATSAIITVTVNPLAANPTASVVQPTCALGTGTINVTAPLGAGNTYSIGGPFQSSPSFPGVNPGTYTVYVQNSAGCFSPATTNVTVNPQPFVPGAPVITGTVNVCPFIGVNGVAGQITYHATATGNGTTTFNWVIPPTNVTIISGQGTADLTVSFQNGFATQANKQLRVTATNECGTGSMAIYYLAAQVPTTPSPIVGPTDACPLLNGPAVTYTIPKAPGAASYVWTIPSAGTIVTHPNGINNPNDTIITVAFSTAWTTGTITVQSKNDCGVSGLRSITVTRISPSQPNIISGPTNACPYITPNTPATYTVPAVPGVTYQWTANNGAILSSAQGSNTMTVSYPIGYTGGTISVTATTGCGTSAARNLTITTLNPATPGIPDIVQTHFCGEVGGRKFTYTLSSTPANATSVIWTVPAGATFINLSPISIEVTYPDAAVNGVVTVQATNPCANSVIRSVNVKLSACPTAFAGNNNGTNGTAESKGVVKTTKPTPAPALAEAMEVKIFPNPTVSDFKLEVLTAGTEEITVRVMDNLGRLYKNFKLMPNQIIALGAELKSGSYLVEVRQGKTVKTTKVIKF